MSFIKVVVAALLVVVLLGAVDRNLRASSGDRLERITKAVEEIAKVMKSQERDRKLGGSRGCR